MGKFDFSRVPQRRIAISCDRRYCKGMADLKFQVPVTAEVVVDAETLAAIDRGIEDADAGRTVSLEEARQMIPEWISKFESRKPR
jgi:hypothetical protein